MDKQPKKILYIGPYNEESNKGKIALTNIKALQKQQHQLKIVPIYCSQKKSKQTPPELISLEKTNLEKYDICIQHCDPMQYSFNGSFDTNIGIWGCKSFSPENIVHTRLSLLDRFVVHSKKIYDGLSRNISRTISKNMVYCPAYIDLNHIQNYKKDKPDWIDNRKYYFYTELEFTEEYDWEKLIYVYLTAFQHKNTGLVIKTTEINDDTEAAEINEKINQIAIAAHIIPNNDNTPKILNGIFDEDTTMMLYNGMDCFIDCGRSQEYNSNLIVAAALNKDIVCNSRLASSDLFLHTYQVNGYPCNVNYTDNDILSSSMYETHYTMECNSLREELILAYTNQYNKQKISNEELEQYDISNINNLLC